MDTRVLMSNPMRTLTAGLVLPLLLLLTSTGAETDAGREIPSSLLDADVEADWGPVCLIGLRRPIGLEPIKHHPNLPYIKAGRALGALVAYNGGWSAEVLVDALAGLVDVVEVCNNLFHRHKYAPR